MLISILASIWSQNLWDELILKNEIKLLREEYKDKNPRFLVYSYDYKNPFYIGDDIEYIEYFPIDSKNKKNIFRNLKNFLLFLYYSIKSDFVVIGWWGIFYDEEKQSVNNPLKSWLFRTNIFRLLFKKIIFFAVGLNIKNDINKIVIKKIFLGAYKITVRDEYSANLLKELWIESTIVLDPVFFDKDLEPILNKRLCLKKVKSKWLKIDDIRNIDFAWKKVALAFRKWYISQSDNDKLELYLIKELVEFIQNKWGNIVLLPHSFHKTDIDANDYAWMNTISDMLWWIEISNSMEETYSYYTEKKVDIILAQRLHSIILAHTYDINFISVSYTKKTEEVLKIIW